MWLTCRILYESNLSQVYWMIPVSNQFHFPTVGPVYDNLKDRNWQFILQQKGFFKVNSIAYNNIPIHMMLYLCFYTESVILE